MATYALEDEVVSAPDSGDVTLMKDRWVARVVEIRTGVTGAPDGCCYITVGTWESAPAGTRPTSRQLWANHIVPA